MGHFKAIPRTVGPYQDRSFATQRPQDRSSKNPMTLDRLIFREDLFLYNCLQIIDMLQKEDMLETEKLIEKKLKTEGGDGGETADVIVEGSPSPVTDKVDDGGDSKSATKVASKE